MKDLISSVFGSKVQTALALALLTLASVPLVSGSLALSAQDVAVAEGQSSHFYHNTKVLGVSTNTPNPQVLGLSTSNGFYPYPSGSLVEDSNGTIYFISGTVKVPFTNFPAFKGLGYSLRNVVQGDLSNYTPTQSYTINTFNAAHPWGSWLIYKGTVYYFTQDGMIGVPSAQVFTSNGGTWTEIVRANKYDIAALTTNPNLSPLALNDPRVFTQQQALAFSPNPVTPTPASTVTPSPTPTPVVSPTSTIPTICEYPAPPQGCSYVSGPNYSSTTSCGMVLSCTTPTPTSNGLITFVSSGNIQTDLQNLSTQIQKVRTQQNKILKDITGSTNTAAGITGFNLNVHLCETTEDHLNNTKDLRNMPSSDPCFVFLTAQWQKLGYSTPPLDMYGSPYLIDENEQDPARQNPCSYKDYVISAGPNGFYQNGDQADDIHVEIPFFSPTCNVTPAQRDAQRKADLQKVQIALEAYKQKNSIYPTSTSFSVWDAENQRTVPNWSLGANPDSSTLGFYTALVGGGYLQSLPLDPVNRENILQDNKFGFLQQGSADALGYVYYSTDGKSYILGTNMEVSSNANTSTGPAWGNYQLTSSTGIAFISSGNVNTDLQTLGNQLQTLRQKQNKVLGQIDGSWWTGGGANGACLNRGLANLLATDPCMVWVNSQWQKLGYASAPIDPWGAPYFPGENEQSSFWGCNLQDMVISDGPNSAGGNSPSGASYSLDDVSYLLPFFTSSCQSYNATNTPSIYIFTPTSASAGAQVVINGLHFTHTGNTVNFGNTSIASLNTVSNAINDNGSGNVLPFTVPNVTSGTYNVTVANSNGTSNSVPFTVK